MSIDRTPGQAAPVQKVDFELRQAENRISELGTELASARSREQAALSSALAWRQRALASWATSASASRPVSSSDEIDFLRNHTHAVTQELEAIRHTLSWRVTKPLRSFRTVLKVIGR